MLLPVSKPVIENPMLTVGNITLRNPVAAAPMSGVSDAAFRETAFEEGAGWVVTEMVASEELARQRPDVVRRADAGTGKEVPYPFVVQLAGREARWMAEGARIAEAMGADIIDINMGCPSRQVTGGLSGSALMRDPDHALRLIEATVKATTCPVSLKMRLGWDRDLMTAPEIARRAQEVGIKLITVHGRTRNQFYKGEADWQRVRDTQEVLAVPLIVNGDIHTLDDAREALSQSGANGIMIGRASIGRPWLLGRLSQALASNASMISRPSIVDCGAIACRQYDRTLRLYGTPLGVRMARKHLAGYIDDLEVDIAPEARRFLKAHICQMSSPDAVMDTLNRLFQTDGQAYGRWLHQQAA